MVLVDKLDGHPAWRRINISVGAIFEEEQVRRLLRMRNAPAFCDDILLKIVDL
jgi:hypothetical protein